MKVYYYSEVDGGRQTTHVAVFSSLENALEHARHRSDLPIGERGEPSLCVLELDLPHVVECIDLP